MIFDNNKVEKQLAVLVGTTTYDDKYDLEINLRELEELTQAAGGEVVAVTYQNIKKIEASTYIGMGKAEEIREIVKNSDANIVIFDNELSGSQIRNLENIIGVRIVDRTNLILDIFALRANSHIAKLQVELAQLKYRLPRLIGFGSELSKTGAGIGTRGPGEQKLEIDKRRINEKIDDIKQRLLENINSRNNTKKLRNKSNVKIVALVGYTNSGKSSIMNRFIDRYVENEENKKKVFEKNMLFATLDIYHRRIDFEDNKSIILIDTVGFVNKLPHYLVEAFKSTLEEVVDADLLVHVVDCSNKYIDRQIDTTLKVISELKAGDKDIITVFNKSDLLDKSLLNDNRADVYTSMKTLDGFDELIDNIKTNLFKDLINVNMIIPYTDGNILNEIANNCTILDIKYLEEGTLINVEINDILNKKYERFKI